MSHCLPFTRIQWIYGWAKFCRVSGRARIRQLATPRFIAPLILNLIIIAVPAASAQPPLQSLSCSNSERQGSILVRNRDTPSSLPENCIPLGDAGTFSIQDIAAWFAPALWFTADEPASQGPQQIDLNQGPSSPIVYYRVLLVRHTDPSAGTRKFLIDPSKWSKNIDSSVLEGLHEIYIRYYFYYSRDFGVGGHPHDLEGLNLEIALQSEESENGTTKYHGEALKVAGSAHGIPWYTNELDMRFGFIGASLSDKIARDVLVPPIVLVEEGKHATVPDRNGDGVYTPSYDVNVYPNDAWGVRDTLRTRDWLALGYSAELTKPRDSRNIIWPPNTPSRPLPWGNAGPDPAKVRAVDRTHYELRAVTAELCRAIKDAEGNNSDQLRSLVKENPSMCVNGALGPIDVRSDNSKRSIYDEFGFLEGLYIKRSALRPAFRSSAFRRTYPWDWFSARKDGTWGLAAVVPLLGFNVGLGWVIPRYTYFPGSPDDNERNRHSVDLLFTRSASANFGWYGAGGWEQRKLAGVLTNTSAVEGGFRFRLRPGIRSVLSGLRIGIRGNRVNDITGLRLVLEIGGGAW